MTAAVAKIGRQYLPRGWGDFARQLLIWFGFFFAYQIARGVADRNPTQAFENGLRVVGWEERVGDLVEVTFANIVAGSHFLTLLVAWTYWNSEFTVLGLVLLYVYLRRHEHFHKLRNWILLANAIGLIGYVLLPTAPPRFFPNFGFPDTLGEFGGLNHGSGLIQLAANPYAAMPSLHAADALIIGVSMAFICRRWWARAVWLAWPAWVWFAVMATGNHFWLDVAAGVVVAVLSALVVHRRHILRTA